MVCCLDVLYVVWDIDVIVVLVGCCYGFDVFDVKEDFLSCCWNVCGIVLYVGFVLFFFSIVCYVFEVEFEILFYFFVLIEWEFFEGFIFDEELDVVFL